MLNSKQKVLTGFIKSPNQVALESKRPDPLTERSRFAESLAPLLLTASRRAGLEVSRFEALKEHTLRDLTTFMEALMLARQVCARGSL